MDEFRDGGHNNHGVWSAVDGGREGVVENFFFFFFFHFLCLFLVFFRDTSSSESGSGLI